MKAPRKCPNFLSAAFEFEAISDSDVPIQTRVVDVHDLEDVRDESANVADEEDKDHYHEHRGQADLFLLSPSQTSSLFVGPKKAEILLLNFCPS